MTSSTFLNFLFFLNIGLHLLGLMAVAVVVGDVVVVVMVAVVGKILLSLLLLE